MGTSYPDTKPDKMSGWIASKPMGTGNPDMKPDKMSGYEKINHAMPASKEHEPQRIHRRRGRPRMVR